MLNQLLTINDMAMLLSVYLRNLSLGDVIDSRITSTLCQEVDHRCSEKWVQVRGKNDFYNFVYVPWMEHYISFGMIPTDYDFLSTRFTGCYMAIYKDVKGTPCAFHIHCDENEIFDRRADWNAHISKESNPVCLLFKPKVELLTRLINEYKGRIRFDKIALWGLISRSPNECYSIVVDNTDKNNVRLLARERETHQNINMAIIPPRQQ